MKHFDIIDLSIETEVGYLEIEVQYEYEDVETYNGNDPDPNGSEKSVTKILSVVQNGSVIEVGTDEALINLIQWELNIIGRAN